MELSGKEKELRGKGIDVGLSFIFLNACNMKGCEEGGMMMIVIRMGGGFGTSWKGELGEKKEVGASWRSKFLKKDNQVNILSKHWRQDHQMVGC